jgi:predicted GNAT family N-acyltransferase
MRSSHNPNGSDEKILKSDEKNDGLAALESKPDNRIASPDYDTFDLSNPYKSGYTIKVVRDFEDMAKVFAIRGSACFTDPEHLYAKHFDGSDFSSTHLLGFIDGEPVGTIRIRYFSDFTRIERLTIRPTYRKSRMAFRLAKAAFAWCRDKGYRRASGVARSELVPFWSMLGFRLTEGKEPIYIYGLPHFDMTLKLDAVPQAVSAMTDTMVLLRSEGRWHEEGHHETINVTKPTAVTAPPPMVRSARRPADVAARLAEYAEHAKLAEPDNEPEARGRSSEVTWPGEIPGSATRMS